MRTEDKQLEGPELLQEEQREVLEERDEAAELDTELPVLASEEVVDIELAHRGRVFDALALVLERQSLTVSLLGLPKRETEALEFLQTAVNGRDVHMGEFVYAEDRKVMLEQALAVLQQNLTHGSPSALATLHAKFASLTDRLGEIRDQLSSLEESEDDHDYVHEREVGVAAAKPADVPDVEGDQPSTLSGDEVHEPPHVSTLSAGGAAAPEQAPQPSTLSAGAAVRDQPPQPSTLSEGPAVPDKPPQPSTLDEPQPKATR